MNTPSLQIDPAEKSPTKLPAEFHALLHGAATYPLDARNWVRITGEDRQRWLNGMVTNSVQSLAPGAGCYNFLLTAQGRIEGDANIFHAGDALLLETDTAQRSHIIEWLDHYIIMDDVELAPMDSVAGIGITGPNAKSLIESVFPDVVLPQPIGITPPTAWRNAQVSIVAAHSPLVPRFELWTAPEHVDELQQALASKDATTANKDAIEWLRLLEGTPLYGADIRNTADRHELPQETAQSHALHFSKGCYLGQEIVERIRSRGNVHRTFSGFLLDGDPPASGATILADDKGAGEITSAARIPLSTGGITVALGYIRREALDRKSALTCNGAALNPATLPISNI